MSTEQYNAMWRALEGTCTNEHELINGTYWWGWA